MLNVILLSNILMLILHEIGSEYVAYDWRRPNDVRRFCISFKRVNPGHKIQAIIEVHSNLEETYCCRHLAFSVNNGVMQTVIDNKILCLAPLGLLASGNTLYLNPGACSTAFNFSDGTLISRDNASLCIDSLGEDLQLSSCEDKDPDDDWYLMKVDCEENNNHVLYNGPPGNVHSFKNAITTPFEKNLTISNLIPTQSFQVNQSNKKTSFLAMQTGGRGVLETRMTSWESLVSVSSNTVYKTTGIESIKKAVSPQLTISTEQIQIRPSELLSFFKRKPSVTHFNFSKTPVRSDKEINQTELGRLQKTASTKQSNLLLPSPSIYASLILNTTAIMQHSTQIESEKHEKTIEVLTSKTSILNPKSIEDHNAENGTVIKTKSL